jgi:hypothetical protein
MDYRGMNIASITSGSTVTSSQAMGSRVAIRYEGVRTRYVNERRRSKERAMRRRSGAWPKGRRYERSNALITPSPGEKEENPNDGS